MADGLLAWWLDDLMTWWLDGFMAWRLHGLMVWDLKDDRCQENGSRSQPHPHRINLVTAIPTCEVVYTKYCNVVFANLRRIENNSYFAALWSDVDRIRYRAQRVSTSWERSSLLANDPTHLVPSKDCQCKVQAPPLLLLPCRWYWSAAITYSRVSRRIPIVACLPDLCQTCQINAGVSWSSIFTPLLQWMHPWSLSARNLEIIPQSRL